MRATGQIMRLKAGTVALTNWRKHPNLFQTFKLLQGEYTVTEVKINQLAHGAQHVKSKYLWDLKDSRIIGLRQRFSENRLPLGECINRMTRFTGL